MGFNYRMTNIAAAIGCAQLERLDSTLARKADITALYKLGLANVGVEFQQHAPDVISSNWLVSLLLPEGADRNAVMARMYSAGIDSRPVFYCNHHMPMYAPTIGSTDTSAFPVAEIIASRGISLPSYPSMTDEMVGWVCEALIEALTSVG
jgi:perosamine synthetase